MFSKRQLEQFADVLFWGLQTARTKPYCKNDIVAVRFNLPALALAERLQARLLEHGLNPVMRMVATAGMERTFFEKANSRQLVFEAPGEKQLYQSLNGSIFLHAPESLTHLQRIDSARIAKAAIARKPLRDILVKREEQGSFGWTLCSFPTPEMARHARLSLAAYAGQVIKACYLDQTAAVEAWKEVYRQAQAIKAWLNSLDVKHYRIESRHIDLKIVRGERRKWVGISGHNIPSFELFLSPDWRGTEGVYYANQPSFRNGNYVRGVRLEFAKGAAVKVQAETNRDFVVKQLAMDRGANKLGEFSLTDVRFSKIDRFMADTLYDENFGGRYGNCHIAVGSSYSDTYDGDPGRLTAKAKQDLGFNDSALHWDLINTEPKIVTAVMRDGRRMLIYENGRFTC